MAQLVIAGEVEGRLTQRWGVDGQSLVIQLVHKLRIPLHSDNAGAGFVAAGGAIGIDGVFPSEPEGQGAVLCPCALAVEVLLVIALQDIAYTLVECRQAWVGLPAGELGLDVEAFAITILRQRGRVMGNGRALVGELRGVVAVETIRILTEGCRSRRRSSPRRSAGYIACCPSACAPRR